MIINLSWVIFYVVCGAVVCGVMVWGDTLGKGVGGLYLASNASIRVFIAAIIAISCVNCVEISVMSDEALDCSVASGWFLVFEVIVYR